MLTRRIGPIALSLLIFLAVLIVQTPLIAAYPVAARALFTEGQAVEQVTVYLWFAAALAAVLRALLHEREYRLDLLLLGGLFLVLAFRELDLNRHIFDWNLTRFVNYRKAYIPIGERLAAFGLILLPIAAGMAMLFARNTRRVWRAIIGRAAWSQLVLFWIALIALSRIADKAAQAIHDEVPHLLVMGVEETGEFVLALYTLLAVWMSRSRAVSPTERLQVDPVLPKERLHRD